MHNKNLEVCISTHILWLVHGYNWYLTDCVFIWNKYTSFLQVCEIFLFQQKISPKIDFLYVRLRKTCITLQENLQLDCFKIHPPFCTEYKTTFSFPFSSLRKQLQRDTRGSFSFEVHHYKSSVFETLRGANEISRTIIRTICSDSVIFQFENHLVSPDGRWKDDQYSFYTVECQSLLFAFLWVNSTVSFQ